MRSPALSAITARRHSPQKDEMLKAAGLLMGPYSRRMGPATGNGVRKRTQLQKYGTQGGERGVNIYTNAGLLAAPTPGVRLPLCDAVSP